jgi:hypothetical protein
MNIGSCVLGTAGWKVRLSAGVILKANLLATVCIRGVMALVMLLAAWPNYRAAQSISAARGTLSTPATTAQGTNLVHLLCQHASLPAVAFTKSPPVQKCSAGLEGQVIIYWLKFVRRKNVEEANQLIHTVCSHPRSIWKLVKGPVLTCSCACCEL